MGKRFNNKWSVADQKGKENAAGVVNPPFPDTKSHFGANYFVPELLDVTALWELVTGNSEKLDRNSGAENSLRLFTF